jgi:DNA-binding LytR/AlgR family response regulator
MKEVESQLGESFCRCHRGYLVNMAYIAEYENDSIRLSNGEKIFMAKERYHEFVKKYMRYLRSGGTVYV